MGGKYRITGDKYPRMRPHRRRGRLAVVVVACGAVLGVAGWGTLQLIDVFTGGGGTATAADGCPKNTTKAGPAASASASAAKGTDAGAGNPAGAGAGAVPKPAQITVNVFNATTRSGLAKTTADELKRRGFKIGEVGNAAKQYDKKVAGTGMLLGPASSLNTSLPVLATQLVTAERRTDAARAGTAVDLIIGNGFKALTSQAEATKALTALSAPHPTAGATTKKKGC
ncbi:MULTISPECIES: LytR C-terminal domain-containing protein [unclassified Streptomyces]|uniref:LytR C-terminal domain-containing protein n=1 Tax=unclassified Streptomyces TaxID=2593676 RepID=UPI0029A7F65F|nr:LytR C-terminal domain-containing protein [Streptomyces sp. FL07-04A]MDX3578353.1 LytR C-terminal domain-containing protein [Streptomyces sp. FL07-04A]